MKLLKVHQYLLMKRECLAVLGNRASNLILLTLVLTATFFAVAFSKASTEFLQERMEDPFTNWVNIELTGADEDRIDNLKFVLENDSNRIYYGYNGIQSEFSSSLNLVNRKGGNLSFSTLFYENLSNELIDKVLDTDNVYERPEGVKTAIESISEGTLGVIMTLDALLSLGYDYDDLPAYVDYHAKSEDADTLGIPMLNDNVYARAPLPLLAIVKRLPMNKDAVAAIKLHVARKNTGGDCPIDLCNEKYVKELFFFVPDGVDFSFDSITNAIAPEIAENINRVLPDDRLKEYKPWKKGQIMRVYTRNGTPPKEIIKLEYELKNCYSNKGVERIYNYDVSTLGVNTESDNIISVRFEHLDSISAFERFVKETSRLQIEMTQVNAKKNFAAVSNLADVLTFAMIVFSLISIIIFIVNMLQSYFQKVKRNLGTFKAFGLSSKELIGVYVMIIIGIVLVAIDVSMVIVCITQISLPKRDGNIGYLNIWNSLTLWTIVIIIASALASVLIVMRRLLRQTPGNLIYDR